MKKIISLFQRNYDGDGLVRDEVTPGAEWVQDGEGIPTVKIDGTCCMVRENVLYRRYTWKPGRTAPPEFEPAARLDDVTGKQEGWVPVGDGPQDRMHRGAFERVHCQLSDGTYELIGPKVQGNPEGVQWNQLVAHGAIMFQDAPRTFDELKTFFVGRREEGIVWHHPDGRMVKIKGRDFGIARPTLRVV